MSTQVEHKQIPTAAEELPVCPSTYARDKDNHSTRCLVLSDEVIATKYQEAGSFSVGVFLAPPFRPSPLGKPWPDPKGWPASKDRTFVLGIHFATEYIVVARCRFSADRSPSTLKPDEPADN